jgi:hypothetical protein
MPPTAIAPVYATLKPNAAIALSTRSITLRDGPAVVRGRGRISFQLTPDSHIAFRVRGPFPPPIWNAGDDTKVGLGRTGASAGAMITNITMDGTTSSLYEGRIRGAIATGDDRDLRRALVHVFNFPTYIGQPVEHPSGALATDRLLLRGGGWAVTMDAVADARRLIGAVRRSGGYALTHVAEFTREDGSPFTTADLAEAAEVFGLALTFARSARTFPCLTVAYDSGGRRWTEWADRRLDPWGGRLSWFDGDNPDVLAGAFAGMWQIWANPRDRSVLKVVIGFATEANGAVSPESRLILAQAGLELLAWHRRRMSNTKFQALDKVDQIRDLLDVSRIDPSLPTAASFLGRSAALARPTDGPAALTAVRNRVAHSPRSTRHALLPSEVLITGWRLSVAYVHLAMLRWLGCEGVVRSALDLSSIRVGPGVVNL